MINARCSLCGNTSGYDKESLKGSTWNINGIKHVLCCPCEDDIFRQILKARISRKRMQDIAKDLMSDERDDLLALYD